MHGKSWIASITCLTFTVMVWPHLADAAEGAAAGAKAAAPAAPAAAAAAPAAAPASDDAIMAQAKQHFEAGRNAYNANDYVTAIREFKQAEQLRPSPILDYNIGLANEKLGKRRVAVKYYKRYLEQQPNAANKAEVDERIRSLEASIAAQPATPAPGGTAPQPEVEQPSDMPPADPNATPGSTPAPPQPQPGYDPYASQPPPGAPVAAKPAKKKSLWWVWLIVAGGVVVTVSIIVVVALAYSSATTVSTYDHADRGGLNDRLIPPQPTTKQPEAQGITVFRF